MIKDTTHGTSAPLLTSVPQQDNMSCHTIKLKAK